MLASKVTTLWLSRRLRDFHRDGTPASARSSATRADRPLSCPGALFEGEHPMPNDAHTALAAKPPIAPAKAAAPQSGIKRVIGEAVASAAAAVAIGMAELGGAGQMPPNVKGMGGQTLAAVAELALDYCGEDFDHVAREEGRLALERRRGTLLRAQLGAAKYETAFDELIGHVLLITSQVVADERALAH
jgi:hypothetical protein